jgi:XisI protein
MVTQNREYSVGQSLTVDRDAYLEQHRQIIIQILMRQVGLPVIGGDIQTVPIFDREGDRYQLLDIGWDQAGRRVFQPIVHVDLIDGKVWIQENMTDLDIAEVLVQEGIQPSQIVLGFYSRLQRQLGNYAIE